MSQGHSGKLARYSRAVFLSLAGLAMIEAAAAHTLTVTVVDDNGNPITHGFRWLLEEDNSYGVKKVSPDGPWAGPAGGLIQFPGTPSPNADYIAGAVNESYTLGVNVHHSHAPVVCSGDTALPMPDPSQQPRGYPGAPASVVISPDNCPDFTSTKNYMVSVLPWHSSDDGTPPNAQTGWGQNGRNVAAGQSAVKVIVHAFPQPTAQITMLVFEDNQSINGAYDQPAEHGLKNFQIIFNDAAGQALQDAWTNPIGTTYQYQCSEAVVVDGVTLRRPLDCATSQPLLQGQQPVFQQDGDGLPVVDFVGDGSVYTCPGGTNVSAYTPYQVANCIDPYTLTPMAAGEAVIRYVSQNKFSIEPVPSHSGVPCNDSANSNNCSDMLLTATLEGTRGNDAWVRGGEPRYNITLGQLNWLVFYGFVHPMNHLASVSPGAPHTGKIQGQVVYTHDAHPPLSPGLLTPGVPVQNAYIGLNNLSGNDEQIYTAAADPTTGRFQITGVPPGNYQLAIWDKPINAIIDYRTITVVAGGTVDLGYSNADAIAVFGWFANVTGSVFSDTSLPGTADYGRRDSPTGEPGIANIPVALRFSDGSSYASTLTDSVGEYSFNQYFAWWRFLVPEVDSSRFKATGVTSIVDNGGALNNVLAYAGTGQTYASMGIRPQLQACGADAGCQINDGGLSRTEKSNTGGNVGVVTTQAMQLYADMTARLDWGKQAWGPGENGGIKGKINYATTRTGEDPQFDVEDGWEPGIPRVKVQLWRAKCSIADCTADPTGWVKDTVDGSADPSKLVPLYQTTSSSWDDNMPTGCMGAQGTGLPGSYITQPEIVNGHAIPSCAETFHNWNQTRRGVYDGQYRFDRYCPNGFDVNAPPPSAVSASTSGHRSALWAGAGACFGGAAPTQFVPPGNYIVQALKPEGYEIENWGTRNIEFGDPKNPYLTVPPPCVGPLYDVPQYHALFPDQQVPTLIPGGWDDTETTWTPIQAASCDTKYVSLSPGANYTADFHMFTSVPKAARIWGTVWNDLALEFNPLSPNASGNLAMSYLPVAIKDWKGTEVARFYTDQWGHFDGLVPTNYDIAPPIPLGLVLSMLHIAPNDPGPIKDTARVLPRLANGSRIRSSIRPTAWKSFGRTGSSTRAGRPL